MKLIVGLGNFGDKYVSTRHNIGFMLLDKFLGDIKWHKDKYGDFYKKDNVLFLKPSTFMNLSGIAVKYYADYYKINLEDILILHDDLDLPFGKLKIKINSSSGGHNGIASIIKHLKSTDFARIKVGISKPSENVTNYVLDNFTTQQKRELEILQPVINDIISQFIEGATVIQLMNKYNQRNYE